MPGTNTGTARRFWITRLGYGFTLGVAITILNFAQNFPLTAAPHNIGFLSFLLLLLEWGGEGILLALIVGLAERSVSPRELHAWQLTLAVVVGAVAAVLTWQAFTLIVLSDVLGIRLFRHDLGVPVIWIQGVFFQSWLLLFFGGLAAAVYASRRRHARMLAALLAAELGRASSQRRLAEARLASLQARVEPAYLLQTLTRLEQAYETDADAADRLLDELIVYLRNALADIRASAASAAPVHAQACDEPVVAGKFVPHMAGRPT
jgi:sensor histidine kinase YesM